MTPRQRTRKRALFMRRLHRHSTGAYIDQRSKAEAKRDERNTGRRESRKITCSIIDAMAFLGWRKPRSGLKL
jgi:hypothetical protein